MRFKNDGKHSAATGTGSGTGRLGCGQGFWYLAGPCHLIRAAAGNGYLRVDRFEVEGLCQALWGSNDLAFPMVDALDTTAAYMRRGDTMAAKLCLRRLNLPDFTPPQLRVLSALGSVIGCGLQRMKIVAACHRLTARHLDGPHWHKEDALAIMRKGALPRYKGKCGEYFQTAHAKAGFDMRGHPRYAWQYADYLSNHHQFDELSPDQYDYGTSPDGYNRQIGDVAVFPTTPEHEYGHIQVWDGKNWVSDTVQPSGWPNRNYRTPGSGSKFRIFRPK